MSTNSFFLKVWSKVIFTEDNLENIGVRGIPLKWFHSYLNGRTQIVTIDGHLSNSFQCSFGVPQGSTLGPTLFLTYINELCKLEGGAQIFRFADDTVLLFHGPTWSIVRDLVENTLRKVTTWLEDSLLSLNTTKTKYICFNISSRTSPDNKFTIQIHTYPCNRDRYIPAKCNCSKLARVYSIKYLGVVLDDKLNWSPQIAAVTNRIRKLIYVFKNLRDVADAYILRMTYLALCQSIISYCICVWGGSAKTHIIELERGQRAVLKVMMRLPFRYPTEDLYKLCDVLTVRKLFIYQCLRRYHRCAVPQISPCNRRITKCPIPICKTAFSKRFYAL